MRTFAIALLVLVAAGCTGDDEPPTASDQEVAIYLVRDGKVAPVRRAVEADTAELASATLQSLTDGPNEDERGDGYATSVPSGDTRSSRSSRARRRSTCHRTRRCPLSRRRRSCTR